MNPKAIVAVVFGYGAGLWFTVLTVKKHLALRRAQTWPSTSGRILESTVAPDDIGKSTHIRIRYEFHLGERQEGETPRIAGDWFWNNQQKAAFVARYAVGQAVEVYYDPHDPAQNCLDRTDRSGIVIMGILAIGGPTLASLLLCLLLRAK